MRGRQVAITLVLAACAGDPAPVAPATTTTTSRATTTTTTTTTTVPTSTTAPTTEVAVRLERGVDDAATAGFADAVIATLTDPRGWQRAGFSFTFRDDAPYTIVLAEGPDVDARCAPYDTGGRFSCQLGPAVALNADRWRTATSQWTGDLAGYRQMLVNHEVGHLLGQHHPTGGCTTPGEPAPVMVQQSTNLDGCLANPWPLDWEISCAAARLETLGPAMLAPPYEADAMPVCGPGDGA